jgi:hypothetical protein
MFKRPKAYCYFRIAASPAGNFKTTLLGYFVVLCHLLRLYSMLEDKIKNSQIIFNLYNQGHWVCSCRGRLNTVFTKIIIIQGAAEWTPTFLKVTGKGVTGIAQRGTWQQFGRIV